MICVCAFSTCVSSIFSICDLLILNGFCASKILICVCASFYDVIHCKSALFTFFSACLSCAFSSFFRFVIWNAINLFFLIVLALERISGIIHQCFHPVYEDFIPLHEVLL